MHIVYSSNVGYVVNCEVALCSTPVIWKSRSNLTHVRTNQRILDGPGWDAGSRSDISIKYSAIIRDLRLMVDFFTEICSAKSDVSALFKLRSYDVSVKEILSKLTVYLTCR